MGLPGEVADPRRPGNAIELRLHEVAQLFNSFDPSPFKEKDLDPDAEEFIVEWAREVRPRHRGSLRLILHLERPLPVGHTPQSVEEAIRHYFAYRASINELSLRQLFQQGRISLLIGTSFLTSFLLLGELLWSLSLPGALPRILAEGLTIGGWVAMWRPMQIYLYDWWPIPLPRPAPHAAEPRGRRRAGPHGVTIPLERSREFADAGNRPRGLAGLRAEAGPVWASRFVRPGTRLALQGV